MNPSTTARPFLTHTAILRPRSRRCRARGRNGRPRRPFPPAVPLLGDGGGVREARPTFLYVYVENTDETYQRALEAGALTIEKPADMPYGDRRATV